MLTSAPDLRSRAEDVPSAPLLKRTELLNHEQILVNDTIIRVDYEGFGEVRQARPAAIFAGTPSSIEAPAPRLGEHSRVILSGLGYSESEQADLIKQGVVVH